jgi:hypothetical protein
MDRQKVHIAAGLVSERKSRRFSLADDEAADPTNFDAMAAALIDLTQEDGDNEEDDSDQDLPTAPSILPSQPTASQTVNNAASRVPAYKKIKLVDLFNYPTADAPAAAFEFFWQGGRDGLDAEEEALASDDAGTAESSDAAGTQAEAS